MQRNYTITKTGCTRVLTPVLFFICFVVYGNAQTAASSQQIKRPKLLIGIVVDQMRWDYLYRYYDRYTADGGFKRMLGNGFTCDNTLIPYAPTITACGHTCIYTGALPAVNGITGNEWWDYDLGEQTYCTGDDAVTTIGGSTTEGQMSPRNLLVTTIGDELRFATNFRSKVIAIALKDRAAVLPAGHSANAAYWYEEATGNWITSSYYVKELPKWVQDFNDKNLPDKYFNLDWNMLYPVDTYTQSSPDEEIYEHRPFGKDAKGFPYNLKQFAGKDYKLLPVTPYGNSLTLDMAKAAIEGEQLGTGPATDMLAISFSTPDYVGHTFGPNSVEAEDVFLRLDKDLGAFFNYLDDKLGKDGYLVFFTADHGSTQVPLFLQQHKIPAGNADMTGFTDKLNTALKNKFGADKLVIGVMNFQVYLNRETIKKAGLNVDLVNQYVVDYVLNQPGVYRAFALDKLGQTTLPDAIKPLFANGYYPPRSGDVQIIFKPQWIEGLLNGGTTHGSWNPYDAHIPLIWYGWNIKAGSTGRDVYMTDIAPTVANLLHIQMPSGSTGHVITELLK